MKTVIGVFPSIPQLEHSVGELHRIGLPGEAISIIAGNDQNRHKEYLEQSKQAARSAGAAAASGASFGGGVGIVASLVALAIPGVGPILAGGAIVNVLAGLGIGAASGGVISALRNMAISHEQAPLYEEAVRQGELLLVAEVNDPMESEVVDLMKANGARRIEDLADTWATQGWSGPKSDPHPHVSYSTVSSRGPVEG